MRVVCIHPAREPVSCGQGPVHVGSAPDDAVVLAGAGVAPRHLTLVADPRGLVLTVRPGCQRVYVNARAVRERALLRYGDTVTVGSNKLLVTTDAALPQPDESLPNVAAGLIALRIVSGVASGQALEIAQEQRLGMGTRHFGELAYGCRIARTASGLVFESDSAAPRVNGWRCSRARLSPDDQVVLGEHRLVVEAPGLQYAANVEALPPPASVEKIAEPNPRPPTEIWWLIAAAALLAAIIALLLYFHW